MLAGEHALDFGHVDPLAQFVQARDHLVVGLGVPLLHGHVKQHVRLFQVLEVLFPDRDDVLELAKLFLDLLGPGLVIPELRIHGLLFQPGRLLFLAG